MSLDQLLNAFGQCRIEPRWHRSQYRARPQPGAGKSALDILCASTRRVTSPSLVGRQLCHGAVSGLTENVQLQVSSPSLRLSRLTSSSGSAVSSFGRACKAFSAPSRKRSRHSSTSATLSPCRRAASAAVVSPLSTLITRAARRFAVQRCTSSDCCLSAICHLARSLDLVLLVARVPWGAGYHSGQTNHGCSVSIARPGGGI